MYCRTYSLIGSILKSFPVITSSSSKAERNIICIICFHYAYRSYTSNKSSASQYRVERLAGSRKNNFINLSVYKINERLVRIADMKELLKEAICLGVANFIQRINT